MITLHEDLEKILNVVNNKIQCIICLKLLDIEDNFINCHCVSCGFSVISINGKLADCICLELIINNNDYAISQLFSQRVFALEKINKSEGLPNLNHVYSNTLMRLEDTVFDFKNISDLKEKIATYLLFL